MACIVFIIRGMQLLSPLWIKLNFKWIKLSFKWIKLNFKRIKLSFKLIKLSFKWIKLSLKPCINFFALNHLYSHYISSSSLSSYFFIFHSLFSSIQPPLRIQHPLIYILFTHLLPPLHFLFPLLLRYQQG
jgi:hypothetical protein